MIVECMKQEEVGIDQKSPIPAFLDGNWKPFEAFFTTSDGLFNRSETNNQFSWPTVENKIIF